MQILLTGATGYVGSRVARRLVERGETVLGTVRHAARTAALPPGVRPLEAPLDQPERLAEAARRADAVLHVGFAGHGVDWAEGVAIEARLVGALAEALAGSGKPLVVANGSAFYGDGGGTVLDETTPVATGHPSAIRAASTRPATTTPGLRGIELRLASFVFGAGGSVFLPILVAAARRDGRSIRVGAGAARTSTVHVDAAADAFLAVLDQPKAQGIYHVAAHESPRHAEIAEAVAIGCGVPVVEVDAAEAARATDPFTAMFLSLDNRLSSARLRAETGWTPAPGPSLLWDVAFGSYLPERRAA